MLDIAYLRKEPEAAMAALASRGVSEEEFAAVLDLDARRRDAIAAAEGLQAEQNVLAKKGKGKGATAELKSLKIRLQTALQVQREAAEKFETALSALPNLPDKSVPIGADEADNKELRRWGEPREADVSHDTIGGKDMDFVSAASLAGSRFVVLRGSLARLERALGQMMLDLHTKEHGYEEISPPSLVRAEAVFGVGQLPKFADDLFVTTDGRYLSPTAEVQLSNLVREQILRAGDLPLRMSALTPCFRAEAGAAGKDTKGMIRQHQFSKVELVSITEPDAAAEELERMTQCAETVLQRLELPYRVVQLCSGDMGFAARKTYDLEVWMPSQRRYREISSCSHCGDFQARRMRARYRSEAQSRPQFVHTLNGSALAIGRTLAALLENMEGRIPTALQPYMDGASHINAE